MFINTDRFQEEYSMNLKRIVSLILALMLAVNTPAALAAACRRCRWSAQAHGHADRGYAYRETAAIGERALFHERSRGLSAQCRRRCRRPDSGHILCQSKAGLCIFSRDQLFVCAADAGRLLSAAQRIARTIGIARTQRIARALRISATK